MEHWEVRRMMESLPDATPKELAEVRAQRLAEWEEELEEFDRKWGGKGTEATGTEATGTEAGVR